MTFIGARLTIRLIALLLAAISLIVPSNASIASENGEFKFVFCTPNGAQEVTWEEITGEPSPFKSPAKQQTNVHCGACVAGCKFALAGPQQSAHLANTFVQSVLLEAAVALPPAQKYRPGPALPSRSPPMIAA